MALSLPAAVALSLATAVVVVMQVEQRAVAMVRRPSLSAVQNASTRPPAQRRG
jgi:hypothetical protein